MISVHDSKATEFTSNGLVVLSDSISSVVTEELNGIFECELEHPLDARGKWEYLIEDNVIKADGQLFRIYNKVKTLTSIRVNARHIFYDLLDNLLEDVTSTDLSGQATLNHILTNTQYAHPFTSISDVGGVNTLYFIRKNPVEAIMGSEGLLSTYGGELVRDNFLIKHLGVRGSDRGVLIAYGKNIQGIEETLDTSGICTRLMPIGSDGLTLDEKYIDSPYIGNYPNPRIKVVDFSEIDTWDELRTAALAYMETSKIDIPQFNYKVDFVELSKTEEYKNYAVLESVYLGDTVTVKHSRLNLNLKVKVIKITKNIITDRIESVELGSFKPNLATGITNSIQKVKQDIINVKSAYQLAIENATALITGSNGGNVVIRTDEAGKPYEILIMDTTDVMTALDVWRWNLGGFGHSSMGVNGPYTTAITQDGSIVGSFITGLLGKFVTIRANQIMVGDLGETIADDLIDGATDWNYAHAQTLDLASDNKFTPLEKQSLSVTYDGIKAEKLALDASASKYTLPIIHVSQNILDYLASLIPQLDMSYDLNITGTITVMDSIRAQQLWPTAGDATAYQVYVAQYNNLSTYLEAILAITGTSDIDAVIFKAYFAAYSTAKANLQTELENQRKAAIDAAQTQADNAQSTANAAVPTTDITNGLINFLISATNKISVSSDFYWDASGFHAVSGDNVVKITAGGIGVSIDGGLTFATAITGAGIAGDAIAANSISASKIKTDELVVGTNVTMGDNAVISWANLTPESQVNLTGADGVDGINGINGVDGVDGISPVLPSYITSTKITQTTIESPTISGGTIDGVMIEAYDTLKVSSNIWNNGSSYGLQFGAVVAGYSAPATIKYYQGLSGDGSSLLSIDALQVDIDALATTIHGDLTVTGVITAPNGVIAVFG